MLGFSVMAWECAQIKKKNLIVNELTCIGRDDVVLIAELRVVTGSPVGNLHGGDTENGNGRTLQVHQVSVSE